MSELSPRFRELWSNEKRSLDISEYEECLNEWQCGYRNQSMKKSVAKLIFFCAGLWALYTDVIFLAVLLLALAAYFQLLESLHVVLYEIMNQNKLLAMLINEQSEDIESLRREVSKQA